MVKDYKITTTVNKERYISLRGKLMMDGSSFSNWLEKQIERELGKPTKLEKELERVAGAEPHLGLVPETATERSFIKQRGELNGDDYTG